MSNRHLLSVLSRPAWAATLLGTLMLFIGSGPSGAAVIEGSVPGWTDGLDCEVWLTDSLDLVSRPPAAVASVEDQR